MKTTTISILRSQIKKYIDGVIKDDEPVLVNKGSDGAVIISLSHYNRLISGSTTRNVDNPIPTIKKNDYYMDVNLDEL